MSVDDRICVCKADDGCRFISNYALGATPSSPTNNVELHRDVIVSGYSDSTPDAVGGVTSFISIKFRYRQVSFELA